MQFYSMQSLKTMHYLPKFDRKKVGLAVSWMLAIAASTIGMVAYA